MPPQRPLSGCHRGARIEPEVWPVGSLARADLQARDFWGREKSRSAQWSADIPLGFSTREVVASRMAKVRRCQPPKRTETASPVGQAIRPESAFRQGGWTLCCEQSTLRHEPSDRCDPGSLTGRQSSRLTHHSLFHRIRSKALMMPIADLELISKKTVVFMRDADFVRLTENAGAVIFDPSILLPLDRKA